MCRVENGAFSWDFANPGGAGAHFNRSPVSFHDNVQVAGTPLFDADQFVLKFNNFWTIETPPGYSMLITHPFNRPDLPFTTLTGLVDCDRYSETFINFPARWHRSGVQWRPAEGHPSGAMRPNASRRLASAF